MAAKMSIINTLPMANVVKWLTLLAVNQARVGSIPIIRPMSKHLECYLKRGSIFSFFLGLV